jgi:hypothetical protein
MHFRAQLPFSLAAARTRSPHSHPHPPWPPWPQAFAKALADAIAAGQAPSPDILKAILMSQGARALG